ncbi:PLP-dependent aminotransferase family protein [Vibrio fluminensis]|uniref:aminotransferase-like domain-containing protein n=1 Tax=Vibrio fluminensis TaxID=2783614 RepID=UPI00188713AD|nr:PLP-dependent aminotransferase family protein [Vibrio fluminensis]
MSKYRELADNVIATIKQGKIAAGVKLPSLRQFAQQHNVSLSTAISCYQELDSQGWIHARPKSGYFVSTLSNPRATPKWAKFQSQVSTATLHPPSRNPFNGPLGVASTSVHPADAQELQRSFKRASLRMGNRLNLYPSINGEAPLRNSLANHFRKLGILFNPDDMVITSGCLSAIKAAIECCSVEGDAVAISSPCFNGIIQLLGYMKRKVIEIPSTDQGIDLVQLEQHLKDKTIATGVFCTSFTNPHGITMSSEQKQQLAWLANHYQTPIIEDDVYIELGYLDQPIPAQQYDRQGYILWCGSFSKSLSPSYRVGWCLPGRYQTEFLNHFSVGSYGVPTPMQLALSDFIESGHYAKHVKKKRSELLKIRHDYMEYLAQHLPSNATISDPQGGLVLWLQIPQLNTHLLEKEAHQMQLDCRVGYLFSTLNLYDDCIRINIGHDLEGQAKDDLQRLVELIHRHC